MISQLALNKWHRIYWNPAIFLILEKAGCPMPFTEEHIFHFCSWHNFIPNDYRQNAINVANFLDHFYSHCMCSLLLTTSIYVLLQKEQALLHLTRNWPCKSLYNNISSENIPMEISKIRPTQGAIDFFFLQAAPTLYNN